MIKEWIPLIATAVGVLLGSGLSILTTYVQYQRQRRTDARKLRLNKLEDLFQTFSEIERYYVKLHTQQSHLALPKTIATTPQTTTEPGAQTEQVPFQKMQMLVAIYAPSLSNLVNDVMVMRKEFGDMLLKSGLTQISADSDPKEVWQRWCTATEQMHSTIGQAHSQVSQLAATFVD